MKYFFVNILFFICLIASAQEICDNAIDDDFDGLIDLNDDECNCLDTLSIQPNSLIPNPSFEEYDCLPSNFSEVACATDWIQASSATSDYFYEGAYVPDGVTLPTIPSPPDGNGFVGFASGYSTFYSYGSYLEYVGACLNAPILQDSIYTFNFDIGFGDVTGYYSYYVFIDSDSIELTFFANPSCTNLPFDYGYSNDCPTASGNGWVELGSVLLTGNNGWQNESFTFTADADYEVLVIGGNCDNNYNFVDYQYVYLDNLVVNTSSSFVSAQTFSTLTDCNAYVLNVENEYSHEVQWYKDGIALIGEVSDSLIVTSNVTGEYLAILNDGSMCSNSNIINLNESPLPTIDIDQGNYLLLEEGTLQQLTAQTNVANYEISWSPSNNLSCSNCDNPTFTASENIIYTAEILDLNTLCSNTNFIEIETYLISDTMQIDTMQIDTMQIDTMQVDTSQIDTSVIIIDPIIDKPCKIYIPNVFSPNNDAINDRFEIELTDCIDEIIEFSIYNRFGERVNNVYNFQSSNNQLVWDGTYHGRPLNSGVFIYLLSVKNKDGKVEHLKGNVTLLL